MKILFIGDIHGNSDWERIILENMAYNQIDQIIFLGDYVDSFKSNGKECSENLMKLITFVKTKIENKGVMLLGNHDYAYIYHKTGISGYNHPYAEQYRQIFNQHRELFRIAWGYTNPTTQKYTLVTHAGLTYNFWTSKILPIISDSESFLHNVSDDPRELPIHEILNLLIDKSDVLWKVGKLRGGSGYGGVLWADYLEIIENRYPGINQIFGHTPKVSVQVNMMDDDLIVCCDNWGNKQTANIILTI